MTRPAHGSKGIVPEDLRAHNRGLVLREAFRRETLSRGDLARATGLTGAAISRITRELLEVGLLGERASAASQAGPGRPTRELELRAGGAFVVGVGIGAYEQAVQIADLRGACLARVPLQLRSLRTAGSALRKVAREAKALAASLHVPSRRIVGCGVAMAGLVDPQSGTVLDSPNLGWRNVRVAERLQRELGVPVCVDAMHHALNLAEAQRSDTPAGNLMLVNVAMGIGASTMSHGEILRGSHAAAGQIGHMHMAGESALCTCGRRGCLDTVASGFAVLRRLGLVPGRKVPKEHRVRDARRLLQIIARPASPRVRKALFECGRRLGEALAMVASVLDPDRFILAGPLSQTESYVAGVRAALGAVKAPLAVSALPADSAGAWLALSRYVLSATLDLRRLRG